MKLKTRLQRAFKAFRDGQSVNVKAESPNDSFLNFLGLGGTSEDTLSEATYFACMKVLCEAIGKLPLKLLQYNNRNGVTNAREHPLYRVLHDRPNPYMTATTFWSTVEFNRNHHGNAYVLIDGAGESTSLWILPSDEVEIWYDDMKILADVPDIYYIYSCGGKRYKFASEEILHFKSSNTLDGVTGVSVQDQLKMTIDGGTKAQKLVNNMYDSGFTAKAVLQYTASLSDDLVKSFTRGIEDYAKGKLKDKGIENIIPIPLGTTLTPLNIKLGDNQFIEVKQYTSLQIASAFGIKPYQIGDYTKSSYASAEAQQLSFYIDTLLYILKQYEDELTYKLLTPEEIANGYHFKFNVAVILRADLRTQIETLSTAVNSFIYTPNEARALLDLESKDGGDELLGNGASIPVQYAGSQYTTLEDNGEAIVETETTVEATPDEIMRIIDAVRTGKLSYEQAVSVIVVTIGYDEETARKLLGNEEDYEKPTEPEEEEETTEEPEEDGEENGDTSDDSSHTEERSERKEE